MVKRNRQTFTAARFRTGAARGEDGRIDPKKVMRIDLVSGQPDGKLWAHTHGLGKFRLPELEIRGVPPMLGRAAGRLLNDVADYLLNDATEPFRLGQLCDIGGASVRLAAPGPDGGDDWGGAERMQLVDDPEVCHCQECAREAAGCARRAGLS
jgi:hypothetical protein